MFGPRAVAPDHFSVPSLLPAGLTEQIYASADCRAPYIGIATVSVDHAGRVQAVDVSKVLAPRDCKKALSTIVRLSLAEPAAANSALSSANHLLVRGGVAPPCLDESRVQDDTSPSGAIRVEGNTRPPVLRHRVQPEFPRVTDKRFQGKASSIVIIESIITKTGCVRSVRMVAQSPFPEINSAALAALSQWKFDPARKDGKPVETIFNLTVNFTTD